MAYSLKNAMEATGEELGEYILLAGGVTKSKVWRQIFADVTGYPVVCPIYDVEANMGDVMPAGIETGLLTYEQVKQWQVLDEKIMPNRRMIMKKWRKRVGYGIGDLGCNLVFSTMASYLMIFYTDVFGISAAVAGTLMLVTKFIDPLTDTGMGIIVDKTHTRWGQGRPYFLIGAIPFAVFTIATFYIPELGSVGKIVWAYVTYCLVSTRMICALLGTAVVMTITAPLVEFFGKGDKALGYLITMSLYGIVAMIIFIITFLSTKEVVPSSVQEQKVTLFFRG